MGTAAGAAPGTQDRRRRLTTALARLVLGATLLSGCATPPTTATTAEGSAESGATTSQVPPQTADLSPATPGPAASTSTEPRSPEAPDEHSAVRTVVEGFPTDLLPLPPDAVVLVTSAAPVGRGEVREVSLNLSTETTTQEVMTLYRESLEAAGFTEIVPETVISDLAGEAMFTRSSGDELVSIGVLDEGERRTVTIGGRVRTVG